MWPYGGHGNRGGPFKQLLMPRYSFGKTHKHPISSKFLKPKELKVDSGMKEKMVSTNGTSPVVSPERISKSAINENDL